MRPSVPMAIVATIAIISFPIWSKLGWNLIPIFMIIAVWVITAKSLSAKKASRANHPTATVIQSAD